MQVIQAIDMLGDFEATTLATATVQKVFASITRSQGASTKEGVLLHNADPFAELSVKLTAYGASAPTLTTTNRHYVLAPKETRMIPATQGLDIWVYQESGGTTNYTAQECF